MKEIYKSWEGKLGVENQRGYYIEEGKKYYHITFISVWEKEKDDKYKIKKEKLKKEDFSDIQKIIKTIYE